MQTMQEIVKILTSIAELKALLLLVYLEKWLSRLTTPCTSFLPALAFRSLAHTFKPMALPFNQATLRSELSLSCSEHITVTHPILSVSQLSLRQTGWLLQGLIPSKWLGLVKSSSATHTTVCPILFPHPRYSMCGFETTEILTKDCIDFLTIPSKPQELISPGDCKVWLG